MTIKLHKNWASQPSWREDLLTTVVKLRYLQLGGRNNLVHVSESASQSAHCCRHVVKMRLKVRTVTGQMLLVVLVNLENNHNPVRQPVNFLLFAPFQVQSVDVAAFNKIWFKSVSFCLLSRLVSLLIVSTVHNNKYQLLHWSRCLTDYKTNW